MPRQANIVSFDTARRVASDRRARQTPPVRAHAGRFADAQHLFPGKLPVHIALQRGQIADILYMLLLIQNRLVQMGDAPSLGNIEFKQLCQLYRSLLRNGISPGTEGHHQLSRLIKGHVAMHHGAEA